MNINLLEHCSLCGLVMYRAGEMLGIPEEECQRAYLLGWVHDCMKPFENNELRNHKELVANFFSGREAEVLLGHEDLLQENVVYDELQILLIFADSIVDGMGEVVGFDGRLADVSRRYGPDTTALKETFHNIDWLRRHGYGELEQKLLATWDIKITENCFTYKKVEEN